MLPEELRSRFLGEVYIAGGCIYSWNKNQTYKDIDMFLETSYLTVKIKDYFEDHPKIKSFFKRPYGTVYEGYIDGSRIFITKNAVSIDDIQIIVKEAGTPEEVLSGFDYKHNMFFIQGGEFYGLVDEFYLTSNELSFNMERPRDIVGSIIRIPKFLEKGFTINKYEIAKMLQKLHDIGFNEEELEELDFLSEGKNYTGEEYDSFGS